MVKCFLSSLAATVFGIILLLAVTPLIFGAVGEFGGIADHLLFLALLSASLLCATWTWGRLIVGDAFAMRATRATFFALAAGWTTTATVILIASQVEIAGPSIQAIWRWSIVVGVSGGFTAGAAWGFLVQGKRLAWRCAFLASGISAVTCALPLTPIAVLYFQSFTLALAYLPFLICSAILGLRLSKTNAD